MDMLFRSIQLWPTCQGYALPSIILDVYRLVCITVRPTYDRLGLRGSSFVVVATHDILSCVPFG